jgi:tetratricopeptide (TPR) repeat protein
MGNHAKALPLHERALAICEAQLGPEHPDTANSLNHLAALHKAMGNHAKALPLHERALAICEAQLGPEHPDTAISLNNLAVLHEAMGNHAKALPLLRRLLKPTMQLPWGLDRDYLTSVLNRCKKDSPKVGPNDPCSCGSGVKYKKCCGLGGM